MGLFIDEDGLIRCRGRFEHAAQLAPGTKYPKLLPKASRYTNLIVQDFHERSMHAGLKHTLAAVRSEYWIPHGRTVVKQALRECRLCRRHVVGPFKMPEPPPLPEFRASMHRPFACVGLDYLGPLMIKTTDGKKKVWIALYTCAVIRAIFLDVVGSLSTADFLLSFRRFVATYGKPDLMVSDNATQFKMADRVIKKLWQDVLRSEEIQNYSADTGIEWKFITELSPWMGGFYERMVRPVKDALKKSLGSRVVSLEELQTLILEVAVVVNNRPLLYSEAEPMEQVLTPAHLMFQSRELFPEVESVDEYQLRRTKADDLIQHWKIGQKILRQFWDCWRNQYLLSLRERHVQHNQRAVSDTDPELGMTVLLKDNLPRGMWRMGLIKKLISSKDGKIRSVEVRLSNGNVVLRPLKLLCPLERSSNLIEDDETSCRDDQRKNSSNDAESNLRPTRKAAVLSAQLTRQQLQD